MTADRKNVRFDSDGTACAAWHYPGSNGACLVMAGGFALPKEPGTDLFAARFHAAGYSVLAFDYRHLGESGGEPRQVVRIHEQLADWSAALGFAATLPEVDATRLVAWGFSASGGHVLRVAARDRRLAAAIAQSPYVDGQVATRNAMRYQSTPALLRFTARGVLDAAGALLRRPPLLVTLDGPRGTVATVTSPDAADGDRALRRDLYPDWPKLVAARSSLRLGFYRPGRAAPKVRCPLLVVACDDDATVLAAPAASVAERAPAGEYVHVPGGHYAPMLDAHDDVVTAELAFLERAGLPRTSTAGRPRQGSNLRPSA